MSSCHDPKARRQFVMDGEMAAQRNVRTISYSRRHNVSSGRGLLLVLVVSWRTGVESETGESICTIFVRAIA